MNYNIYLSMRLSKEFQELTDEALAMYIDGTFYVEDEKDIVSSIKNEMDLWVLWHICKSANKKDEI